LVVVLIIAILIAIAIPTFLGARQRANDRAAQSSLRNALTAAKTSFTDTGDYSGAIPGVVGPPATGLTAVEPSLTFVTGASANTVVAGVTIPSFKVVSIIAASAGQVLVGSGAVQVGEVLRHRGQLWCRWRHHLHRRGQRLAHGYRVHGTPADPT
jgi:Tfp pilus assembly protein PilE